MRTKNFTLFFLLLSFILALESFQEIKAQSYTYSLKGGTVNSTTPTPTPAVMLIGGAESGASWGDAATAWFLQHSGKGDYLVIRFGSIGGQASWVWTNFSSLVSSAAEIAINDRTAANDPVVEQYILNAEAIFFAGGDQNNYEDNWKNTKVEDAVNYLINVKGVPVSGTSAGMAILGESYYAPSGTAILGSEILNNPYNTKTTNIFHGDFINIPILNNVITETHANRVLSNEMRYSRAFGMLARVYADNANQLPSYAIVCDEATHVCIDGNGIAKVYGNGTTAGADAYFLQTNGSGPETIQSGSPLVWNRNGQAVKAYHIKGTATGSGSFNLNDWYTASGGDWENWYTTGGAAGFNYTNGSCTGCTGATPPNQGTNSAPTAEANGPYTGLINTAVSFNSSGSIDSDGTIAGYLWNFGDGSTSTAANPTHAYTVVGNYNVTLTVTDNLGATGTDQSTATITNSTGSVQLLYTDFESGLGAWTDGGADCALYTSRTYAYGGTRAANIQDNSGTASSFYLTSGIDVHTPGFVQLKVEFYFYAVSMETGEDFWVQYYNGSTWSTIATYISGTNFSNGAFTAASVTINEANYTFPTSMKIRFMCDASDNNDDIYIDNIKISASTSGTPALKSGNSFEKGNLTKPELIIDEKILLFPNPTKSELNIVIPVNNVNMKIISSTGNVVKEYRLLERENKINVTDLPSGIYFIYIDGKKPIIEKFIKE